MISKVFPILFLVLASCNTCNSNRTSDVADVKLDSLELTDSKSDATFIKTYNTSEWSLSASSDWVLEEIQSKEVEILLRNNADNIIFVLKKEEYHKYLDQYAIETIRGFKAEEVNVLSSNYIEDDTRQFVHILSSKEFDDGTIICHTWITVINGYGYSIDCGGQNNKVDYNKCNEIFKSLRING